MIYKIRKALIEGKFVDKTIKWIKRIVDKTIKWIKRNSNYVIGWIDRRIGFLSRAIAGLFIRVREDQIMFISFQGDYCCNPKYISEEIIKQGYNFKMVYSGRKATLEKGFPIKGKVVEQYTADFYEEIMRSKVLVVNSVEWFKKPIIKKKGQIWIETWHGSLGIKRFDKDHNNGIAWVKAAERLSNRIDYLISNSSFEDGVYKGSYWPNTEILQYGHPRNDILFLQESAIRKKVYDEIGLDSDTHYILYAPTFRDSHSISLYFLDFKKIQTTLSGRFGGNWKVLMRLHPTVRKKAINLKNIGVIDVTAYQDMQELMLIADVAITDYSSWIYDFILTRRPGFIYAPDLSEYDMERGFYYSIHETPFPIAEDEETLVKNIYDFNEAKYLLKVEDFLRDKGCVEDGHAAERVVEKLKEIMAV